MKEYKNIDNVFKESASGFKPKPSGKVWSGIINEVEKDIVVDKSFNYRRLAALVLLLLLTGSAIWYFIGGDKSSSKDRIIADKEIITKDKPIVNKQVDENLTTNQLIEDVDNTDDNIVNNVDVKNKNSVETTLITDKTEKTDRRVLFENTNNQSDINNEIEDNQITNNVTNINFIKSSSIYDIATADYSLLDKKIDLQEYMLKRKNLHTYSAISAKAALMYYPNTTDQFTYTVDAEFGIVIKDFYIQSGIGYQKVKERGIYNYYYKTNDSIGYYNKVLSFEINPLNPDEITYKTAKTTVYDSIEHIKTHSPLFYYDYLNVPIKIGYRIKTFDKLNISIESGVIFSKLISSKTPTTNFYIPESTLLNIEDKTPLRTNFNYQWVLALKMNYKILNSVSISVAPEYTKYLNSIYKPSIGVSSTKPYSMGIRFGIYYDF